MLGLATVLGFQLTVELATPVLDPAAFLDGLVEGRTGSRDLVAELGQLLLQSIGLGTQLVGWPGGQRLLDVLDQVPQPGVDQP